MSSTYAAGMPYAPCIFDIGAFDPDDFLMVQQKQARPDPPPNTPMLERLRKLKPPPNPNFKADPSLIMSSDDLADNADDAEEYGFWDQREWERRVARPRRTAATEDRLLGLLKMGLGACLDQPFEPEVFKATTWAWSKGDPTVFAREFDEYEPYLALCPLPPTSAESCPFEFAPLLPSDVDFLREAPLCRVKYDVVKALDTTFAFYECEMYANRKVFLQATAGKHWRIEPPDFEPPEWALQRTTEDLFIPFSFRVQSMRWLKHNQQLRIIKGYSTYLAHFLDRFRYPLPNSSLSVNAPADLYAPGPRQAYVGVVDSPRLPDWWKRAFLAMGVPILQEIPRPAPSSGMSIRYLNTEARRNTHYRSLLARGEKPDVACRAAEAFSVAEAEARSPRERKNRHRPGRLERDRKKIRLEEGRTSSASPAARSLPAPPSKSVPAPTSSNVGAPSSWTIRPALPSLLLPVPVERTGLPLLSRLSVDATPSRDLPRNPTPLRERLGPILQPPALINRIAPKDLIERVKPRSHYHS